MCAYTNTNAPTFNTCCVPSTWVLIHIAVYICRHTYMYVYGFNWTHIHADVHV